MKLHVVCWSYMTYLTAAADIAMLYTATAKCVVVQASMVMLAHFKAGNPTAKPSPGMSTPRK